MPQNEAYIALRVQANAKRSEVLGMAHGLLRVRVAALAREGRANAAVIELLARSLGVPKNRLRILRGHTSRDKLLGVQGMSDGQVHALLNARLSDGCY